MWHKTGGKQQGNACGAANSRSGCWTCLMMNGEDKMLTQLISEGIRTMLIYNPGKASYVRLETIFGIGM